MATASRLRRGLTGWVTAAGVAAAVLVPAGVAAATPFGLPPGPRVCPEAPERDRWVDAGVPDRGLADPVISAHRGFPTRAPENTLWSYRYAFGAGADLVEVDVRETADGRFVSFHDDTVDEKTDGSGPVEAMTFAAARALNVADNDQWRGSAYDPAPMAALEEVLALARRVGGGVELDVKSVRDAGRLADLLAAYGLLGTSVLSPVDPAAALAALTAQPTVRLIYNRDIWETQDDLYFLGSYAAVFGSRLDEYTPEAVVAIHDACAIVVPHSYDLGPDREGEQTLTARAIGADGVQTNQPDVVLDVLDRPVPTRLIEWPGRGRHHPAVVCLVNGTNRMGLPDQPLTVRRGHRSAALRTGVAGCAALPPGRWLGGVVHFAGTGAARPSTQRLRPRSR